MRRRQVVVIGLGRFGTAVAITLARIGHEVLAIDLDRRIVDEVSEAVTHAVRADGSDPDVLARLGVRDFDTAIVGVSNSLERSILVTLQLKRIGVRYVIAKAQDDLHREILEKVGADRIVLPEREAGVRIAHGFSLPTEVDYMAIGPDYGISKLAPPPSFVGRSTGEIDLAGRHRVSLLMIERRAQAIVNPGPDERIAADDLLVIAGLDDEVEQLIERLKKHRQDGA
jgi:trk system potassium uptake protein TrkA